MKRSLGFLVVSALGVAGFVAASSAGCASTAPDREQVGIGPEHRPTQTAERDPPPGGPSSHSSAAPYPSGSSSARAVKRDEASREAQTAFDLAVKRYTSGQGTLQDAITWSERARDGYQGNAAHRDRLVQLEQVVIAQAGSGAASNYDVHVIAYYRALAESNAL
jgi:hypothetical protein